MIILRSTHDKIVSALERRIAELEDSKETWKRAYHNAHMNAFCWYRALNAANKGLDRIQRRYARLRAHSHSDATNTDEG